MRHVIRGKSDSDVVEWDLRYDDESDTIDLVPLIDGEPALSDYDGALLSLRRSDGNFDSHPHDVEELAGIGVEFEQEGRFGRVTVE